MTDTVRDVQTLQEDVMVVFADLVDVPLMSCFIACSP